MAEKMYPLTPPEFFAPLHERFRFTVDACAEDYNAVLPRYWTPEDDGLRKSWTGERVWCNPPYDDIVPWLRKAWGAKKADLIVMLLPADRTWQDWWQGWIEEYRDTRARDGGWRELHTEFLPGRMRHLIPHGNGYWEEAGFRPYGHVLAIWS